MLIQTFVILITAVASYMFMTWLVTGVFHVTDHFTAAGYETLGTLVIFILIIVPMNTVIYRRRIREINTLSEGISSVAGGNYGTRIESKKGDQMTPVYEDFNKMCAELSSVQILRNDFINSYSHEFKTPIASINGFASLLLEKDLSEAQRREYLQIIVDESARLSNLANNTILLSKLSSQQIVTDTQRYDISEQIRQCAIILSKSWLDKKIEFSGEFPPAMFVGNKELMQHLWLNLLGNAIKFTPTGGRDHSGSLIAGRQHSRSDLRYRRRHEQGNAFPSVRSVLSGRCFSLRAGLGAWIIHSKADCRAVRRQYRSAK